MLVNRTKFNFLNYVKNLRHSKIFTLKYYIEGIKENKFLSFIYLLLIIYSLSNVFYYIQAENQLMELNFLIRQSLFMTLVSAPSGLIYFIIEQIILFFEPNFSLVFYTILITIIGFFSFHVQWKILVPHIFNKFKTKINEKKEIQEGTLQVEKKEIEQINIEKIKEEKELSK